MKYIDWSNKTFLIAEDEEINYLFLEEALKHTSVKILRACNGEEAVLLFKSNAIDLVLMDIKMPKKNGYDAKTAIKEINSTVPIIAQTAYALSGEKEKILSSGFDDYIAKPIKQANLLEVIMRNI
jgi:CheY-like chemotaxis protein